MAQSRRGSAALDGVSGRLSGHRPLDDLDLAAVPLFVVLREVWLMGLHAGGTRIFGQFILDDAMLDRRFAFLKTWVQHLES